AAELGFHRSATCDYENALRLQPDRALLWQKLGAVHLALQRRNAARTALLRGIELDPDAPRLHELLALSYAQPGDELQAARAFARAFDLRERMPTAASASAADVARALGWSERAEQAAPRSAEASYLRGRMLEAQGRGAEALVAYELALAKDPRSAAALERLARLRSVAR
ncbi:MAG: hypothetical protein EPO68_13145, partial [Planctomycetota bacterium]